MRITVDQFALMVVSSMLLQTLAFISFYITVLNIMNGILVISSVSTQSHIILLRKGTLMIMIYTKWHIRSTNFLCS